MLWVNIKLALTSILSAKIRSLLTMVAIIIGVAAFTLVTTLIEGMRDSFASQVQSSGAGVVRVLSGNVFERNEDGSIDNFNIVAGLAPTLSEADVESLEELESVAALAPITTVSGNVKRANIESSATIVATNDHYLDISDQTLSIGSFLSENDSNRNVAVIGSAVAEQFFSANAGLGSTLSIGGEGFFVIGILDESTATTISIIPSPNNSVFIPVEAAKKLNGGAILFSEIHVQTAQPELVDETIKEIEEALLPSRGGEANFVVAKQDEVIGIFNDLIDTVKLVSQVISYIMIFVGGVVILLIMYISVAERTKEIGVRKSIGATNTSILVQFLTESIVLTLLGSALGMALAYGLGLLVKSQTDIAPVYSPQSLIAVAAISVGIGILAGLLPALQAARKNPIESLRYE